MKEVLVFLVGGGLLLNLYLVIKERGKDSISLAIWKYFSFYTILTNIVVLVWLTLLAFSPETDLGRTARNANVSAAIIFYIVTVGVGNYLIFGITRLKPLNQIADAAVHVVTPIAALLVWVEGVSKDSLTYAYAPYWLIYPLSYAAYTALHGIWSKFYPYPFTNVQVLGAVKVAKNALWLSICVFLGSIAFIAIGKSLSA